MPEKLETLQKAQEALMAQLLRHAENLCDNFHLAQSTGAVDGIITLQTAIDALDRAVAGERHRAGSKAKK
jgi:hypothetical protein